MIDTSHDTRSQRNVGEGRKIAGRAAARCERGIRVVAIGEGIHPHIVRTEVTVTIEQTRGRIELAIFTKYQKVIGSGSQCPSGNAPLIEGVISITVRRGGRNECSGSIVQTDVHAGDVRFTGILHAVGIFIEPDRSADLQIG